ncbi:unnamed protein product [Caenorhabditis auriculariae]|uniref:Uncharacterized protein n=1 Tax=Caenorhabditis auriculariae TaxID=2777116 RepID=A0A8S1HBP1_9PELO|nr:unnamed protein product [Caenorhabditis auriculariae]
MEWLLAHLDQLLTILVVVNVLVLIAACLLIMKRRNERAARETAAARNRGLKVPVVLPPCVFEPEKDAKDQIVAQ